MGLESQRAIFRMAFMAAAYLIPFELLILGTLVPQAFPTGTFDLVFATISGTSVLWAIPVSGVLAARLT